MKKTLKYHFWNIALFTRFNLTISYHLQYLYTDLDHELVARDSLAGPGLDVEEVDVVLLEDLQGLGQGAHSLRGGEDDVEGPRVLRVLVHDDSALDHARLPNGSMDQVLTGHLGYV